MKLSVNKVLWWSFSLGTITANLNGAIDSGNRIAVCDVDKTSMLKVVNSI